MLQPIGYPDKFVRYSNERENGKCECHSRSDARQHGKSGLEQFTPFFNSAKLSLWWLPDVNNMCRIRALEARTRSSAGEKVVAGRPGGYNLGFEIEPNRGGLQSDLRLMEAGKGEKNENVNFIVIPSPLYDNAFRFEGAYRRGYYLAFRPSTQLKMTPYSGGPVPNGLVVDFTLVDFDSMFKFIDIEEVLRPAIESYGGWVSFDRIKSDPNVTAYFTNILQKQVWDDDDFQMYFEGHYEMWQFRSADDGGPAVRLRGVDERLGFAMERVKDADEAASLISTAGDDLKHIHWRYVVPVFQALAKAPATEDVSAVVQRMDAHRSLLGALLGGVLATASEACLGDLARLARVVRPSGTAGATPDVVQKTEMVCQALAKLVLTRAATLKDAASFEDINALLALPGMGSDSDVLARVSSPALTDAPMDDILAAISTAHATSASGFLQVAGQLVLRRICQKETPVKTVSAGLLTACACGLSLEGCAAALRLHATAMETDALAAAVAALGERGCETQELVAACQELSLRLDGSQLSSSRILSLAVAATKSSSLTVCMVAVVKASVKALASWPAADAIRLLLAVAKAKKADSETAHAVGIPADAWASLLTEAAVIVAPHLSDLPAAELIRLALAAKTGFSQGSAGSGSSEDGGRKLLEAVATEAVRRLSDLPQAHLLLLTQGLVCLGGKHPAMRQICSFWGETSRQDCSSTDEVSKRRKEMERGQALSAEQIAKLALVLEPLSSTLDSDTADHCFSGLGARILPVAPSLAQATKTALLEHVRKGEGIGSWEHGREKLLRALEARSKSKSKGRSRGRRSSSSSSRSRGKKRGRQRSSRSGSRRRSRSKSRSKEGSRRRSKSRSKSKSKSKAKNRKRSKSRNRHRSKTKSRSRSRSSRSGSESRSRSRRSRSSPRWDS